MDRSKSTANEFAAPLTLSLEENSCIFTIKWRNAPGMLVEKFESPQELLTVFLNGDYLRLITTRDLLDSRLSYAKQIHIDDDSYLEES